MPQILSAAHPAVHTAPSRRTPQFRNPSGQWKSGAVGRANRSDATSRRWWDVESATASYGPSRANVSGVKTFEPVLIEGPFLGVSVCFFVFVCFRDRTRADIARLRLCSLRLPRTDPAGFYFEEGGLDFGSDWNFGKIDLRRPNHVF
jgi:hypothetical protein